MCICLTCPPVGKLTTEEDGADAVDAEVGEVDVFSIRLMTAVASFFSVAVGGADRGRESTWLTVC